MSFRVNDALPSNNGVGKLTCATGSVADAVDDMATTDGGNRRLQAEVRGSNAKARMEEIFSERNRKSVK